MPVRIKRGLHDLVGEGAVAGKGLLQEAGHKAGRPHCRTEFAKCCKRRLGALRRSENPKAPGRPPSLAAARAESRGNPHLGLLLLHNASSPRESLCGELRHPRRRSRGEPNKDVVEVGTDHHMSLRISPAEPVLALEVGEERLAKLLEGAAEGHREKKRPKHIPLLDPKSRPQLDPVA